MRTKRRPPTKNGSRRGLPAAIHALHRVRAPLFTELVELLKDPDYLRGEPAHHSCIRPWNQMRISPLEAEAIREALLSRPELRRKLSSIRRRLYAELRRLPDSTRRLSFNCPLLERKLCLVHHAAKPIGCLAWNPGRPYSDAGWFAFARRDALNDALYGRGWKLRAIPLWLARVLGESLRSTAARLRKGATAERPRRPRAGR